MSRFKLSEKSLNKLEGVHDDLVEVVKLAITLSLVDFSVGEGLRSVERQKQLVKEGKSKTMLSRHLTGHAVDLWAIDPETKKVTWESKYYDMIANAMFEAAAKLGIPLGWGGNWKTFKDLVHFELPKSFEKYKETKKMIGFIFTTIIAVAANAHVCAANPADTQSVLDAMKPGVCAVRKEEYKVNP